MRFIRSLKREFILRRCHDNKTNRDPTMIAKIHHFITASKNKLEKNKQTYGHSTQFVLGLTLP